MAQLENPSKKDLTPRYLYDSAKMINCLCLPIRVRCGDDSFTLRSDCICYSDVGVVLDISVLHPNVDTPYFMTVYDLYETSKRRDLHRCKLRLADAMAVSFWLKIDSVKYRKNEICIDVSKLDPVEYDDLAPNERVWDWNIK